MAEGQDPPWNLPKCYPEQLRTVAKGGRETQKLPEQMGQPGHEGNEMAVIIITSQIPPVQSPFPKLIQIHYLTELSSSGHCRPGAVRPIWQDEATELREVKRFAQGHTAHLLSGQPKRDRGRGESVHQWTCNSILYLPT